MPLLQPIAPKSGSTYINADDGSVVIVDAEEHENVVRTTLTGKLASLRHDEKVHTCADFGHLNIECCETCHTFCAHYELDLISLESGGQAWICCALDRALNPQRHLATLDSPEYLELEKLFYGNLRHS